jgi:hypothetical protein
LLALDIQCQQPDNCLVHLIMLEYCNSECAVAIGKALRVVNNGGSTVKTSTVLEKSLCGITEGSVDTKSTIFVQDF